jgi:hypothetical protein
MTTYTFQEHCHNYSVWTSARAVQRSFTTTANIKRAIERSSLRRFAETDSAISESEFEAFHRKCSNEIIQSLRDQAVDKVSYGRAAKIIAIYLKTSVIVANTGNDKRSLIIHPPIDSILLKNLSDEILPKKITVTPWTLLDEDGYWSLVSQIKALPKAFNWTLEEHWWVGDSEEPTA